MITQGRELYAQPAADGWLASAETSDCAAPLLVEAYRGYRCSGRAPGCFSDRH